MQLIENANANDVILVEKIDRLKHLNPRILNPYKMGIKKAPIIKIGAFESGRRNRIRTNDLYHVKVAL